MEKKESIGIVLSVIRKTLAKNNFSNMKQSDISDTLGIDQSTYSRIELGKLELKASELFDVLKCLYVSPNDFRDLLDIFQHLNEEDFERIVQLYFKLPPRKFRQVLKSFEHLNNENLDFLDIEIRKTLNDQINEKKIKRLKAF